jgi:hypothetical protein
MIEPTIGSGSSACRDRKAIRRARVTIVCSTLNLRIRPWMICLPPTRLKELGIEPVRTADQGATTSFYYLDPDGNCIELVADNFGDWEKSGEYMRNSPEFVANPMGTFVDADKMIAARQAGISPEELHRRVYAGEFPPSKPIDPRCRNELYEDL